MKFIHCGDTHLGRSNFRLEEREEDFFKAFEKVVDTAIDRKVDFVVHSGDLFDAGKPSVQTIIRCVKQLKRLKKTGIPFLAVWGSHDVSIKESPLQLLDELGLAVNLADSRYHDSNDDKIVLSGETVGKCYICGLPGRRARARAMYSSVEAGPKAEYNIFVFHHTVSEADSITADIPISLLPHGFNYYAGGHWHKRCDFEYSKGVVVYPGSTEFNTVDEMDEERGFYIVDTDGGREWFKSNQRDAVVKEVEVEGSVGEVNSACLDGLPDHGDGEMVIIRLKGRLTEGTKTMVDKQAVNSTAQERGFLTARVYTSDLQNPDKRVHVQTRSRSLKDIEKDFLKESGYSDEVVDLALSLINVLGEEMTSSEQGKAVKEAKKIVGDVL